MIACLYAYDGWSNLNFLAEEMVNFETKLPYAIVTSVSLVIICYIAVNIAYLSVLSVDTITDSDAVAIDFGNEIASGNFLSGTFAIGVALSAAGSAYGSIMTGGRAFYAVARDKMAPSMFAKYDVYMLIFRYVWLYYKHIHSVVLIFIIDTL